MDKELEELVGKLIKLDDWQKEYGHFKIGSCEGEFVTRKGEAKFRVYFLKESVCPGFARKLSNWKNSIKICKSGSIMENNFCSNL